MSQEVQNFNQAATEAVNKELRSGLWRRHADYELQRGMARYGERYIRAIAEEEDNRGARFLSPAGHGPDGGEEERLDAAERELDAAFQRKGERYAPLHIDALFLELARLVEDEGMDTPGLSLRRDALEHRVAFPEGLDTETNAEVMLDWAGRYGVLGLTPRKGSGRWGGDTRGGEGDTVPRFVYEAWAAGVTLRLYEAATSVEPDLEFIREHTGVRIPDRVSESALYRVREQVQLRLERHCYPRLYDRGDGHCGAGYGFTSLLGAVWLQMAWLLTATGEQRRCEWCNRVIAIEDPEPVWESTEKTPRKERKTYRNKKYCDSNCKQHAYNHRRKSG